jgi:hypothetical protein
MNNPSSLSSSSSAGTSMSSTKSTHTHDKNKDNASDSVIVTINEKVNLTKQQHHVLNIICDTYQMSFSEYIHQEIVEAMRFDIEEGNLSDALLEKIGGEDTKKDNPSPSPSPAPDLMKSDLDLLKKLQTQI